MLYDCHDIYICKSRIAVLISITVTVQNAKIDIRRIYPDFDDGYVDVKIKQVLKSIRYTLY